MVTVVAELVRQLVLHCTKIPWLVNTVFEKYRDVNTPSRSIFLDMFASFTAAGVYESIWVVIDGVDAICTSASELKTTLRRLQDTKGCSLLLSTRHDYFEFLKQKQILRSHNYSAITLDVDKSSTIFAQSLNADPGVKFSHHAVSIGTRLLNLLPDVVSRYSRIRSEPTNVRLSFPVVQKQLEFVLQGRDYEEIEKRLKTFPGTLQEFYKTRMILIERSDDKSKKMALKVLSWLYYSQGLESLTVSQLKQALSFRGRDILLQPLDYISETTILESCQGLVVIRFNYVHFLHSSFHAYLTDHPPSGFLSPQDLAETCLESLSYEISNVHLNRHEHVNDDSKITESLTFHPHAAQFWATYAPLAVDDCPRLTKDICTFVMSERRFDLIKILREKSEMDKRSQHLQPPLQLFASGQTPLHVLVSNKLDALALLALKSTSKIPEILDLSDGDIDEALGNLGNTSSKDDADQTIAHYVAFNPVSRTDLLDAILRINTNVGVKSKLGNTPMHCSAYSGNKAAMEILVQTGAQWSERNEQGMNSLHIASAQGHLELVKILCGQGADLSVEDNQGLNSLHYATTYGQVNVMEYIAEKHPDLINTGCVSPLHKAAELFQFEALKYLVSCRADVMKKATITVFDLQDVTPLEIAIRQSEVEPAEELISAGAYLLIDKNFHRTTGRWAHLNGDGERFGLIVLKQNPGAKASRAWDYKDENHDKPLTVEQLDWIRQNYPSHPVPRLLLAKSHAEEANKKYDQACKLFESFCSLELTENSVSQSSNSGENFAPNINEIVHSTVRCNSCGMHPLRGLRYKCTMCPYFDLCHQCFKAREEHRIDHPLMRVPTIAWLHSNNISILGEAN